MIKKLNIKLLYYDFLKIWSIVKNNLDMTLENKIKTEEHNIMLINSC